MFARFRNAVKEKEPGPFGTMASHSHDTKGTDKARDAKAVRSDTAESQFNAQASLYPWSTRHFTTSLPSSLPRYGAAVNSVATIDGRIYLMCGLVNVLTDKGDL